MKNSFMRGLKWFQRKPIVMILMIPVLHLWGNNLPQHFFLERSDPHFGEQCPDTNSPIHQDLIGEIFTSGTTITLIPDECWEMKNPGCHPTVQMDADYKGFTLFVEGVQPTSCHEIVLIQCDNASTQAHKTFLAKYSDGGGIIILDIEP